MRITNQMTNNRMLQNINRNARRVDKLYNQLSSGKKVIFPSDNPILAARALKFRTSVYETEQYQSNVTQGLSWMEVTESAFTNVSNITSRIRELLVQGASDENSFDDRLKIVTDIEQLVKQLGTEMNTTYGGRYVFSGYRTDNPPVITKSDPAADFDITQYFVGSDIETLSAAQTDAAGNLSVTKDVSVLKLAYSSGIDPAQLSISGLTPTVVACAGIDDVPLNALDADSVYFVEDTGNLVLGANVASAIRSGTDISVSYNKLGLEKGELNPVVYFECIDNVSGKMYNMDSQNIEYEFGANTRININTLAKDVYTDKMYADLVDFCSTLNSVPTSTLEGLTASIMASNPALSEEEAAAEAKAVLEDEQDLLRQMSQTRFNSLLGLLDKHIDNVTRQHTDLGSRMSRLELIQNRLEEDRINYKSLLSQNEDVDYTEAAMELNTAESVYQAALQVGAKIIQLTLANYIG